MRFYLFKGTDRPYDCIASTDDEIAPVFLIGFSRSGTTLLDRILNTWHNIEALEEKPLVQAMIQR